MEPLRKEGKEINKTNHYREIGNLREKKILIKISSENRKGKETSD